MGKDQSGIEVLLPTNPNHGRILVIVILNLDYFPPAEFMKEAGNVFSHAN